MSISRKLCEVRDREFGGNQKLMAEAWSIHEPTLSRWINSKRIPEGAWYDYLAERLGTSVDEVHKLCQAERNGKLTASAAKAIA